MQSISGIIDLNHDLAHVGDFEGMNRLLCLIDWDRLSCSLVGAHLRSTYPMRAELPHWDQCAATAYFSVARCSGLEKATSLLKGLPYPILIKMVLK